jgi:hypothetical protein
MNHQLRIALFSGHHNIDGGDALDINFTSGLTEVYYYAFKRLNCDIRMIIRNFIASCSNIKNLSQ